MEIKPYTSDRFHALRRAFNEAFSDGNGKMNVSERDFRIRLHELHINFACSRLLMNNETVLGFALHAYDESIKTAYNGGTGIVPQWRRKGHAKRLMEESLTSLQNIGCRQALLEVVECNHRALALYDSCGFEARRLFRCFKRSHTPTGSIRSDLSVEEYRNWERLDDRFFGDYPPSFTNRLTHLHYHRDFEQILVAKSREKMVGYVVFQPLLGRIGQIAVAPESRRQKIGSTLIYHVQKRSSQARLAVMNVPDGERAMIDFLESRGFRNEINQIEMVRKL